MARTNYTMTTILLVAAALSGCPSMGVEPWERDVLAKEEMQLITDPVKASIDDHIYFSKEASSGGRDALRFRGGSLPGKSEHNFGVCDRFF